MADFVFNIAKGRVAELYNRVRTNDPANSVLVVMALDSTGLESDATLKDKATFAAVYAGTTNEATNGSYARVTLDNTAIGDLTVDNATDAMPCDIPDVTFAAVAAGNAWGKLVVGYDPDSTGGTDADIIPLTAHDFVVTPDGSDIVAQINTAGFYKAS